MGQSVKLEGQVNDWNQVVAAGYTAAKYPFKQVINDITLFLDKNYQNVQNEYFEMKAKLPQQHSQIPVRQCDILIIGAGIVGSAIARELSKYDVKVMLVEKAYDVAVHASSRNDGMIHPGIAAHSNSLKCKLNVRGNKLYEQVSKELGVPIKRCGSSILFRSQYSKVIKPFFWLKAKKIGMTGLSFMNQKAVYEMEPNLAKGVVWGVFCASAGVTSPYKMTDSYAENVVQNVVELLINTEMTRISKNGVEITTVHTNRGDIATGLVINAAGVYSDFIAEMADDRFFSIHPRKGEVVLLDKKKAPLVNGILGFVGDRSSKNTKGGGIIKTYEGNILVGPNAIETPERENYSTQSETIAQLLDMKLPQMNGIGKEDTITYFTGIRAATYKEDFIIEASESVENLIHVAGIQSPGFASAPAIAEMVEKLVKQYYETSISSHKALVRKLDWNPIRATIPDLANLSLEERQKLISQNPNYGEIVCRCEEISRGEIIDALKSPIPVYTVDGVKRRVRAGMGRCQGGFCLPLVMEIIHEQTGLLMEEITKKEGESRIVLQKTK
jgi:glycerol-3-phosphate dehydrogenase